MDLNLTGKVALVTGASQGLGHAIAQRLAEEGMAVAIAARNTDRLHDLATHIQSHGGQAFVHAGDLSTPTAPAAFAAAALRHFGRIDLIVNNAGATKRGDFLTLTEQDWTDGFALKFFAAVRLSRAAWPHLIATHGSIINIAGVGGRTGTAEFTIGGAVNAAMLNLTKSLADRGIADGIRVNAINPGAIVTDRLTVRIERLAVEMGMTKEDAARELARQMKISRFGQPIEIADAVAFLASDRAAYLRAQSSTSTAASPARSNY